MYDKMKDINKIMLKMRERNNAGLEKIKYIMEKYSKKELKKDVYKESLRIAKKVLDEMD